MGVASFNTFSDSSNTAVRAFLTKVGGFYNEGKKFDTTNGIGKVIWKKIKEDFDNSCGYCDSKTENLTMEHLVMMNRYEYGLHHPGNVMPCCKDCNKRLRDKNKKMISWKNHLKKISGKNFEKKLKKIEKHMEQYRYPCLSEVETKAIKVIAESLYQNITLEGNKAYGIYLELRKEFL
jgi:hypothetical protein